MRFKPRVVGPSIRLQVGPDKVEWIEIYPSVDVVYDERDDSFTIVISGTFKLKGTSPTNWLLSREA